MKSTTTMQPDSPFLCLLKSVHTNSLSNQASVLYGTFSEKLLVKEDPGLYHHINQGCLGVDGMDDQEEMRIADVCSS